MVLSNLDQIKHLPTLRHQETLPCLQIIQVNHTALLGKVEELSIYFTILHRNMHNIKEKIIHTEFYISTVEDTPNPLLLQVKSIFTKLQAIEIQVDDLENRVYSNNSQTIGMPECMFVLFLSLLFVFLGIAIRMVYGGCMS